jgi:hypothetical protein
VRQHSISQVDGARRKEDGMFARRKVAASPGERIFSRRDLSNPALVRAILDRFLLERDAWEKAHIIVIPKND